MSACGGVRVALEGRAHGLGGNLRAPTSCGVAVVCVCVCVCACAPPSSLPPLGGQRQRGALNGYGEPAEPAEHPLPHVALLSFSLVSHGAIFPMLAPRPQVKTTRY